MAGSAPRSSIPWSPMRASPFPTLAFQPRESVHDGILRLAAILASEGALRTTPSPALSDETTHQMRLLIKRARSLLRLLQPSLPTSLHQREQDRLRRAAGSLAASRDATVSSRTLNRLTRQAPASIRPALQEARAALKLDTPPTPRPTAPTPNLHRSLANAAQALHHTHQALLRASLERHGWKLLSAGIKRSYRRFRKRGHAAHTNSQANRFHDWRTATKALLYQLSFLLPAHPQRLGRLISRLDQLQKDLGDDHDLEVLRQRLRRLTPVSPATPAGRTVKDHLQSAQQRLRKRALKRSRPLLKPSSNQFVDDLLEVWRPWRRRPATPHSRKKKA